MASKRRNRSIISRVALAALLLAVQVTVAGHLDLDGHSQETQCALCISVSSLDAANVGAYELVVADSCATNQYLEPNVLLAAPTGGRKRARAPPVAS